MEQLIELQIRYNDFDGQQVVNNANIFSLIENSHLIFFERIIGNLWNWSNVPLVLSKIDVTFIAPITTKDNIYAKIEIVNIDVRHLNLKVQLTRGELVYCIANLKIVHYDFISKKSAAWNNDVLYLLKKTLQNS